MPPSAPPPPPEPADERPPGPLSTGWTVLLVLDVLATIPAFGIGVWVAAALAAWLWPGGPEDVPWDGPLPGVPAWLVFGALLIGGVFATHLTAARARTARVRRIALGFVVARLSLYGVAAVVLAFGMVRAMSDPYGSAAPPPAGVRVDGDRITVRSPVCAQYPPLRIEVWDRDGSAEDALWQADDPVTAGARTGALPLWTPTAYGTAPSGAAPDPLPEHLRAEVVTYFREKREPLGAVEFSVDEVRAMKLGPDRWWTEAGPVTGAQIDAGRVCPEPNAP
ncbi:hypothetical protein ACN20G_07975 [Streptomyces sp. BI20]|uniref:hypothetical protein n=1 Tax=Streptomyces sp. BI20 TaxID=3403460 RepID=UPI003C784CC2